MNHFSFRKLIILMIFFSLGGCSAIEEVIRPDEKAIPPTWPSYEQILKENYKGPKARVVIKQFIDKSAKGKESSLVGEGITEMLSRSLVLTNRYIVIVGKSLEELLDQESNMPDRLKTGEIFDLLIEGTIREFKPGVAGAGESGEASYVTLMVKMTNPKNNKELATERIRAKAIDVETTAGKTGVSLSKTFRDFSKTPMEKAIRKVVEESASFIVAKTPPESYRVVPVVTPKESPKPVPALSPEPPKVTPPPPPPPPPTPLPPLRMTFVVWAYVNLREGPGTNHRVIGNVKKGTSLGILEVKGDWLRVRLEDGKEAWVSKLATSEVSPSSPTSSPPKPSPM